MMVLIRLRRMAAPREPADRPRSGIWKAAFGDRVKPRADRTRDGRGRASRGRRIAAGRARKTSGPPGGKRRSLAAGSVRTDLSGRPTRWPPEGQRSARPDPHSRVGLGGPSAALVFGTPFDCRAVVLARPRWPARRAKTRPRPKKTHGRGIVSGAPHVIRAIGGTRISTPVFVATVVACIRFRAAGLAGPATGTDGGTDGGADGGADARLAGARVGTPWPLRPVSGFSQTAAADGCAARAGSHCRWRRGAAKPPSRSGENLEPRTRKPTPHRHVRHCNRRTGDRPPGPQVARAGDAAPARTANPNPSENGHATRRQATDIPCHQGKWRYFSIAPLPIDFRPSRPAAASIEC